LVEQLSNEFATDGNLWSHYFVKISVQIALLFIIFALYMFLVVELHVTHKRLRHWVHFMKHTPIEIMPVKLCLVGQRYPRQDTANVCSEFTVV
jgi:hypothetical protein